MSVVVAAVAPDLQPTWLPDFCRPSGVFAVMVLAQLVVVVMLLPASLTLPPAAAFEKLAIASLLAQWLALMMAALLCGLRPVLLKLPALPGLALAWLLMVVIAAVGSQVVHGLDRALALGLTPEAEPGRVFVLGNTLICALVAAAALRYFYILEQWRAQVRAHARSQVEALQARIRPHFLFNSLNTVAGVLETDPKAAERALIDLCDLFRAALSDRRETTLDDELELVRRYLDIEQLRLGARLRVDWQTEGLPGTLPLPSLILQPLVENAVYHGIQPLEAGGEIRIRGRVEGREAVIQIENPCPSTATPGGHGLALDNVRQRLGYLYGDRARLAAHRGPGYYHCELRLPLP